MSVPNVADTHTIDGNDTAVERRNRVAIVLLLISTFVVFLNETVMSVAVPDIMKSLHVTASAGQWLTTAFALTMAVVIPVTGFLLQRINTRPAFVLAMSLFSAGTLIAALAPTFGFLVVARVVQACGTGIMMPLLMTTVLTLVPISSRGRIMGRISIVISVAPAIGPAVSGLILSAFGEWRFLFVLVLPIAIAMLVIGIVRVPNVGEPRRLGLDVVSVILSAFAFSGVVYGLSNLGAAADGTSSVPSWIPLAIGAVFLVSFVLRQLSLQRRDDAFLDLRTFRSHSFTTAVILFSLLMISMFGMVIVLPIYVQNVLGQQPAIVGTLLLPGGLIMGLLGPVAGRLYDRFGPRPLVIPAAVVISGGFWMMAAFTADTSIWFVLLAHVTLSIGLGILFTVLFTAGTAGLPPHLYSHGSALIATIQQVSGAAGTASFVALLALGTAGAGATDAAHASAEQTAAGVHMAFLAGAIVSVISVGVTFFVRRPVAPEVDDAELTEQAEQSASV